MIMETSIESVVVVVVGGGGGGGVKKRCNLKAHFPFPFFPPNIPLWFKAKLCETSPKVP